MTMRKLRSVWKRCIVPCSRGRRPPRDLHPGLEKGLIGAVLVLAEALAVALLLSLFGQGAPPWGLALVGHPVEHGLGARAIGPLTPDVWFLILPEVTLEAYAWGLFGSSLKQRV